MANRQKQLENFEEKMKELANIGFTINPKL